MLGEHVLPAPVCLRLGMYLISGDHLVLFAPGYVVNLRQPFGFVFVKQVDRAVSDIPAAGLPKRVIRELLKNAYKTNITLPIHYQIDTTSMGTRYYCDHSNEECGLINPLCAIAQLVRAVSRRACVKQLLGVLLRAVIIEGRFVLKFHIFHVFFVHFFFIFPDFPISPPPNM